LTAWNKEQIAMTRDTRLNARCTAAEKELLVQVAQAMQRTASDTLRVLVYEKARALDIPNPDAVTPQFPPLIPKADYERNNLPESAK
jgi:hypothetical protein